MVAAAWCQSPLENLKMTSAVSGTLATPQRDFFYPSVPWEAKQKQKKKILFWFL